MDGKKTANNGGSVENQGSCSVEAIGHVNVPHVFAVRLYVARACAAYIDKIERAHTTTHNHTTSQTHTRPRSYENKKMIEFIPNCEHKQNLNIMFIVHYMRQ
jgi:hypothetical protein